VGKVLQEPKRTQEVGIYFKVSSVIKDVRQDVTRVRDLKYQVQNHMKLLLNQLQSVY